MPRAETFRGQVLTLLVGVIAGQGLTILIAPLLTRLYQPGDWGTLAIFASLLSAFLVVGSGCYERAIPIAATDREAAKVVKLSIAVLFGSSLVCALLVMLLRAPIGNLAGPDILPYLWLLPVGLLGAGCYQIFNFWAVRKREFKAIAKTKVAQGVAQAGGQAALGAANMGAAGLIIGDALGRAAGGFSLAFNAWRSNKEDFRAIPGAEISEVARRYRTFPLHLSWASLLHLSATALPPLLFAGLYSKEVAGWYALGQRVIWMPMAIVGQSVAQVFIAHAAHAVREKDPNLPALYGKTLRRLVLLGAPPMALLALVGGPAFAYLFGEPWREAGVYMQWLAVVQLAQFAIGPLFQVLNVLERNALQLACEACGFVLIVGGIVAVHNLGGSARTAIIAYGAGTLGLYALLGIASYRTVAAVAR